MSERRQCKQNRDNCHENLRAKTMQTLEKIMGAILIAGLAYTFITMVFLAIAIVIKNSI
jgi:hypothetical protein